ncbi:hypothetical protein D3C72_2465520 [compost metagenome]
MLARFRRADCPLPVQMIGQRNIHRIHLRVLQQLLIASVSALDAELARYAPALVQPPAGYRLHNSGL